MQAQEATTEKNILVVKLDDVVSKVQSYNPLADIDLIKKAYVFSAKAHAGQKRRSGQPYLIHPLEVANILAEMKMDVASISAGILHDTIEDTKVTREELKTVFGEEIAELVDGVTKLSKIPFNTRMERQAENFRKMILAMAKDIRVILIKLADRLNNLRTLQFMPEEKQIRIAQETLDIYAPLANRLGMQWMKVQLEDLGLRFTRPQTYQQIEKKIARLKKIKEHYMDRVEKGVTAHFMDSIRAFKILGRMKHVHGIYRKMERQNISFEQVHDLLAFRILVPTVEECYEALGLLHSIWKPVPGRFKDYLAMPKANNYQSLHTTVICLDGERVEFQIRTFEMNETAEQGIAAHWKYKEDGRIDMKSEETFRWLHQLVDWQNELKDSVEFLDTVKLDLFTSEIYVFTPKGDVRPLPHNATPIDFAYSIHTDVGAHCTGARVNGRIVPLTHHLASGDTVEIITSPHRYPSRDWLKVAVSSRARAKVRQFLKQEQREKSIHLGKEIYQEECAKFGIDASEFLKSGALREYLEKKGIVGENSLYSALAYGKISMPVITAALFPEKTKTTAVPPPEGFLKKIFRKVSKQTRDVVRIDGLEDLLIAFGKCCHPIQGDPIVGFVTRGRGVTLHRIDCPKVPSIDPARRVNADWNYKTDLVRTARLKILCEDKPGMLAEITAAISSRQANITKALVRTTRDKKAVISMDVGVRDTDELHAIMKSLEKIEGVISVERELG
ncbi:MAG: bifunctional (p)ppGpp synthetase/guanosine-3',5'-bis(diphosphate) 3'-pyrophosphohydrolase [Deltaproteobacteria bacterium]|nr:bifunctional (p)ppGpp synthetase/guanosine-3',5'-bis(diphosphate) 3'-pyrophosphohydrolase [Deltaproteobacteria bacterium]